VAQGLSYYHAFVETFPTIQDLANAPEEDVLKLWQGLGYYSRARNMHHTAKVISTTLKGKFPETAGELEKFKGIGPYTAAAIASICFGEQVAVVDGNVNRVISRFFGVKEAVDSVIGKKKINQIANSLVPKSNPGDFNQAMMEFGALLCTPQNPQCTQCPLSAGCYALGHNMVDSLPIKTPKKEVRKLFIYYFRVEAGENYYLRKRIEPGIWRNLFEFPSLESFTEKNQEEISEYLTGLGIPIKSILWKNREYRHILSHRDISARVIEVKLQSTERIPLHWVKTSPENLSSYAVSRLMEKIMEE
jgi:A/G-specific adenine glycosylase